MIGNDYYKLDKNIEFSYDRMKSLTTFYLPLIGNDAYILYENLLFKDTNNSYEEINELLTSLNISIDIFESSCNKLNEYHLLKTLNKDNYYILILNNPKMIKEFIKDDILVRDFIMKTSGEHYQNIISNIFDDNNYPGFKDISSVLPADLLIDWNKENESYLINNKSNNNFNFDTLFDVNIFLKDISTNLLPMRFRTKENMKQMAILADLYNISYDKMRTFLPRVASTSTNHFDLNTLKNLCMKAKVDYIKTQSDNYDIPCQSYLMSLQNGKEVTNYDKIIIFNLANNYHLSSSVINVLLEHTLKNCDNRLIEKYINALASDMHRNDIKTAKDALDRLNNQTKKKNNDKLPTYDSSKNKKLSETEINELLALRGENE